MTRDIAMLRETVGMEGLLHGEAGTCGGWQPCGEVFVSNGVRAGERAGEQAWAEQCLRTAVVA